MVKGRQVRNNSLALRDSYDCTSKVFPTMKCSWVTKLLLNNVGILEETPYM